MAVRVTVTGVMMVAPGAAVAVVLGAVRSTWIGSDTGVETAPTPSVARNW